MRSGVAATGDAVANVVGQCTGFAELEILAQAQARADTRRRELPLLESVARCGRETTIGIARYHGDVLDSAVTGE